MMPFYLESDFASVTRNCDLSRHSILNELFKQLKNNQSDGNPLQK